jgi:F420-0:gamma-glutamyl ligase
MAKGSGVPAAIVRGVDWRAGGGGAAALVRRPELDLFR